MPKPRILFVEDEDYIARVIKSSLEDAGYEVFRANSLVQGRVEAATRSPELLILDLGLPDGDGTDPEFPSRFRFYTEIEPLPTFLISVSSS